MNFVKIKLNFTSNLNKKLRFKVINKNQCELMNCFKF